MPDVEEDKVACRMICQISSLVQWRRGVLESWKYDIGSMSMVCVCLEKEAAMSLRSAAYMVS